jgi:hypothetical protein
MVWAGVHLGLTHGCQHHYVVVRDRLHEAPPGGDDVFGADKMPAVANEAHLVQDGAERSRLTG